MSALQNLLRRWLKLPGDPTPPAPPHFPGSSCPVPAAYHFHGSKSIQAHKLADWRLRH